LAIISAQGVWAVAESYGPIEVLVELYLAFGEAIAPLARWDLELEVLELDAKEQHFLLSRSLSSGH